MSDHQISLPENIYNSLLMEAQASGISPTDWIASQLSLETKDGEENHSKSDIEELLGAIDSDSESTQINKQLSPSEKAKAFREWAESHRQGLPLLSDEAISRESIYSDERL